MDDVANAAHSKLQNKHYWICYNREIIHCYRVQQLQNREIKAIKPQCTLMKIIVLSCFPISASSFKEKQTACQESFSKHPVDAASPSQGLTVERAAEQVCVCLGTLTSCPRPLYTSSPQPNRKQHNSLAVPLPGNKFRAGNSPHNLSDT